jgi:uncharacterized radical SAM superfamily Fe-S cluster-containing enzyme
VPTKVSFEIDVGQKTFANGLLPELIAALRRGRPGDLFAVVTSQSNMNADFEAWCRFTRNSLIESTVERDRHRFVIRFGEAPREPEPERAVGSRVWLYTNFDCNLQCSYCCVRSSPRAARRPLGLESIRRVVVEAAELGVREFFLTGGEPFLLPDIGEIIAASADAAATTVLTNGMLFSGRRLTTLRSLRRDRVAFQISLDSPTPERHDRNRGTGSWERALKGIETVRAEGFRVRLAATISSDAEAQEFRAFLDAEGVAEQDRIVRRVALRGFAEDGLALARADLVPEVTITAEGVYWHPIGAEDADLKVRSEIFPLAESFEAVRLAFERESEHERRLARIFNCA